MAAESVSVPGCADARPPHAGSGRRILSEATVRWVRDAMAQTLLREGATADEVCIKALQDHVKATIAPYKYPRSVKFIDALPKTQTGKIQRFRLRPGAN